MNKPPPISLPSRPPQPALGACAGGSPVGPGCATSPPDTPDNPAPTGPHLPIPPPQALEQPGGPLAGHDSATSPGDELPDAGYLEPGDRSASLSNNDRPVEDSSDATVHPQSQATSSTDADGFGDPVSDVNDLGETMDGAGLFAIFNLDKDATGAQTTQTPVIDGNSETQRAQAGAMDAAPTADAGDSASSPGAGSALVVPLDHPPPSSSTGLSVAGSVVQVFFHEINVPHLTLNGTLKQRNQQQQMQIQQQQQQEPMEVHSADLSDMEAEEDEEKEEAEHAEDEYRWPLVAPRPPTPELPPVEVEALEPVQVQPAALLLPPLWMPEYPPREYLWPLVAPRPPTPQLWLPPAADLEPDRYDADPYEDTMPPDRD